MFFALLSFLAVTGAVSAAAVKPRQANELCTTLEGSSGPATCSEACQGAYQVLATIGQTNPTWTTTLVTEVCDVNNAAGADIFVCATCFASGLGDNNSPWANSATTSSDQTYAGFLILAGVCAAYDESGASAALQVLNSNTPFNSVPSFYQACTSTGGSGGGGSGNGGGSGGSGGSGGQSSAAVVSASATAAAASSGGGFAFPSAAASASASAASAGSSSSTPKKGAAASTAQVPGLVYVIGVLAAGLLGHVVA